MVKLFGKLKKVGSGVSKDLGHLATKGHAALKEYAEKAPERRQARLEKLTQQAQIAEAEARLARAQASKQKARGVTGPAMGFGMSMGSGMGSPSMGMGVPSIGQPAAKPARKKKKGKSRSITIRY